MREIIFKAKRKDNGEWVEGLIWKKKCNTNKIFISCFPNNDDDEEVFVVDPKSICQYTGLTDKNGNKIWENDICRCIQVTDISDTLDKDFVSKVFWEDFAWNVMDKNATQFLFEYDSSQNWCSHVPEIEVLGNVFDNPELLEGGAE